MQDFDARLVRIILSPAEYTAFTEVALAAFIENDAVLVKCPNDKCRAVGLRCILRVSISNRPYDEMIMQVMEIMKRPNVSVPPLITETDDQGTSFR